LYISWASQPKEIKMPDPTEPIRRQRLVEINAQPGSREALEAQHGQVWDTQELGQEGSLEFQHDPRFYFNFRADDG
jgi:hypothetical protein